MGSTRARQGLRAFRRMRRGGNAFMSCKTSRVRLGSIGRIGIGSLCAVALGCTGDSGDANTFACGAESCDQFTQYCEEVLVELSNDPPLSTCRSIPAECADQAAQPCNPDDDAAGDMLAQCVLDAVGPPASGYSWSCDQGQRELFITIMQPAP
jgi:hypothetical protein